MKNTFGAGKTRDHRNLWVIAVAIGFIGMAGALQAMNSSQGGPLPQPMPLFPEDNWWNLDVSAWPVDPGSSSYITFINNGGTRHLHPDLGGKAPTTQDPSGAYGIPYAVVSGVSSSDLLPVQFDYADESDGVDHTSGLSLPFYPIPPQAINQAYWIEGGDPGSVDLRGSQDRHLLIVDADHNYLYELYNVWYNATAVSWHAGSGAFFDMNLNNRRPDGWTSADAAGLAILPGLIRYDEVYNTSGAEILHAFRATVRATHGYVYPASHAAGSTAGALPLGARLRLKASVNVAQRTTDANMQKVFRALQKFGLIVADNGSDMYITGTYDTRWDSNILNPAFSALTASDFEVIQLGYNSTAPTTGLNAVNVSPATVTGGQASTGTVSLTGSAPPNGLTVSLTSDKSCALVPNTVTVPAGSTSANFTVSTFSVSTSTSVNITASDSSKRTSTTLTVNPPGLSTLSLNPAIVDGGTSTVGTVTLSAAAPIGGAAIVLLSSKNSVATVPATILVPAGKTSVTFAVKTVAVNVNTTLTISATYLSVKKSATLTVRKKRR